MWVDIIIVCLSEETISSFTLQITKAATKHLLMHISACYLLADLLSCFLMIVDEVALGYDDVLWAAAPLSGSPLLFVQMWRVEELWRQDGAHGFHSVHNVQKQPLVVVIHESYGGASVAQSTRSTNLKDS